MPGSSERSEAATRRQAIDPALRASGWKVVPYSPDRAVREYQHHAIEEFPTANGPADYALVVDGQLLGIVEAKRTSTGAQNVLTQAERYARGIEPADSSFVFDGLRSPFLYSADGVTIWHRDVRHSLNLSRRMGRFHTPAALQELCNRDLNEAIDTLHRLQNDHPMLRPYQREANEAVEDAIARRVRQMMVAMATGTGKTFTTVNQVYRLMKAGVGRRVLFLVDRRALAAQAVRAFHSFEAEPGRKFSHLYEVYSQRFQREDFGDEERFDPNLLPNDYLTSPKPGHAFVYVCTIQRMLVNLFGRNAVFDFGDEAIDEDADQLNIPIHAFDIIVADECHRGYTRAEESRWRDALDHFDAIRIGLTATPAAHTTAYFRNIVFKYPYERAVAEGFLVDYDLVKVHSEVRVNGVFLNEGEQVGNVDPETGAETIDLLEDERSFDSAEIEQKVTAPHSNRRILEEVKTYTDAHEERCGRFPKTLIFAQNDIPHISHANQLVATAREIFGRGESFVQKVTGSRDVDRPLQRIREFRNRPLPGIVVTVDMLSTGVDIPDLECIVFLRFVKSRILFEQMLGRGTRKGEHFPDKSHFTVFDCFNGTLIEYFRETTGITAEPPDRRSRPIEEIIEDIWQNRDRSYNTRCLVKRLQRIEKEMSGDARELFAAKGIAGGDMRTFAANLPGRLRNDFTNTMQLLRDPDFQALLVNYPRKQRTFIRAYETQDIVTSEYLIRDGVGNEYRPQDYLEAFVRFVHENAAAIEAIRILLDRPQDWSTNALTELRRRLLASPLHFSEQNLRRAHELTYHKSLIEIISMVKHAADEEQPLLTAAERVNRALATLTTGQNLSDEQTQWLDRIRNHLIESLTIDRADFDEIPILQNAGGWGRANRAFGGTLDDLIRRLNEAIAA